jgi:hypothetical protein
VRAVILPGPHCLEADSGRIAEEVTAPKRYLYDPDPAVSRSGLLPVLAGQLGATLIEPGTGGFCTSDDWVQTPFAAVYRVEELLPFHARRVGAWLKAHDTGRITVVKRGSSVDAEELVKRWKLRGNQHRTVILTRTEGEEVAIIAERLTE